MLNHSFRFETRPMKTIPQSHQASTLACRDAAVEITWADGHFSRFPTVWLLEACRCARCGDTETAVRHVRLTDKPPRPEPVEIGHDDGSLDIDWGDRHRSRYDLAWLRYHCLSPQARAARRLVPRLWGREMQARLPRFDLAAVQASGDRRLEFLESILYDGFAILTGVPPAREHTEEIAALVGRLRMTNYGIYELESKPRPEIVADMAHALAPHTDEPYRVDPPGITFFHVIEKAASGGATTLVDGFRLAAILRERDPAAFEILARVPARFHRSLAAGRLFEYQHPIIHLDGDGEVVAVRLLDRALAPVDCAPEEVEPFYAAIRAWLELAYAGDGQIEFSVDTGEILVFNNQRLLHGRTAFDPAGSRRHIRSCHVDLDEFHSSLRLLYRERNDPRRWMTFRKD